MSKLGVSVKVEEQMVPVIEDFLTQAGVVAFSRRGQQNLTLVQTCHLVTVDSQSFVLHFMELFSLNGGTCNMKPADYARRDAIVTYMDAIGMLAIKDDSDIKSSMDDMIATGFTIVPESDQAFWNYKTKFRFIKRESKNWTIDQFVDAAGDPRVPSRVF